MLSSNASQPDGVVVICIGEYDTEQKAVWKVAEVSGQSGTPRNGERRHRALLNRAN